MLVEKSGSLSGSFGVGDTVQVRSTGQVGKIVGFEGGRYRVQVATGSVLVESANLSRKEILMG